MQPKAETTNQEYYSFLVYSILTLILVEYDCIYNSTFLSFIL